MGLTRLQLISRVRNRLSATSDDALLTTSRLYEFINDGIQAFSEERDWPWLEATSTISVVAGTTSYALPTDFTRAHLLDIDGNELQEVQYGELIKFRNNTAAQPELYALVGDTVRVMRTPDTAYTLNVYYQRKELELANDADVTYAPSRVASILTTYAALYAAVSVRDQELITSLTRLRDDELKRTVDAVQRATAGPRIQTRTDIRA